MVRHIFCRYRPQYPLPSPYGCRADGKNAAIPKICRLKPKAPAAPGQTADFTGRPTIFRWGKKPSCQIKPEYSGLTKTSTVLARLSSKRTIL
ncbi:hypothetical protein ACVQK6_00250 [Neisseria meningitidis]